MTYHRVHCSLHLFSSSVCNKFVAQQHHSGRLVVITGPSGVGKGTLLGAIFQRHPDLHFSISATTRAPRSNEVDGQHYYFLSKEAFEQRIQQGEFLEWAEFAGNFYGTPKQPITEQMEAGGTVILEIELDGARQVRQTAPNATQIFILPPSMAELETRIRDRGQDQPEAITKRLAQAQIEIAAAEEFDFTVTNDDLDTAIETLESLIFAGS